MGRTSRRTQRIALAGLVAVLVATLAAIQIDSFHQNRSLGNSVSQSYRRNLTIERLLSLLQDVETGQRGYALTGKPDFLQPYDKARPQIAPVINALRADTHDTAELDHVRAIQQLATLKLAISTQIIASRRQGATDLRLSPRGKVVMDRFRAEIAALRHAEIGNLERLLRSSANSNARTQSWTLGLEALLLALLSTAFLAYMTNVARLARVTAAARDMSRRQVAIFDAASDAMIVIDDTDCIEGINPAGLHLFRIEEREAVGRGVDQLFEGDRLTAAERPLPRDRSSTLSNETGLRGDGSRFEAEVAASTVALADSVRTLLIVRDSTERNRIERMKNEFVSTVSHELRTPLTSIRGSLTLLDHLIGPSLQAKPLQLLTMAKTNSERLSILIDDILSIEKIGSGSLEFNMERMDVVRTAEQAVEQNHSYAAGLEVELILTAGPEPMFVLGDPNRLLQAITNLISNACKFSRHGGVVSIIAECLDGKARISVADQGEGIPLEFRSRLFERFSQAQGQRTSRAGTGLGLAITKSIVERHGGEIDYDSTLGAGTVFRIELPLAEDAR